MSAIKPFTAAVGAGLLAVAIATSALAQAPETTEAPPKNPLDGIEKMVVDAIEKGLNLLSLAVGTVLPYKLPEILPNGDIIIRYSPPPSADKPPAADKPPVIDEQQRT